jgi:hypothetical protein
MNHKLTGAAAAAVLTLTGLTACGGGGSSAADYCPDVKAADAQFSGLSSPSELNEDTFSKLKDAVHKIADEAPDDIKPTWTSVDNALEELDNTLKDAGLSMDDFGDLTKGNLPPNMTIGQAQALAKKLQNIDTSALTSAGTKIQSEVKSKCNFQLKNLGD